MTLQIVNQLITLAVLICFALGFLGIAYQFKHFKSAVVFAISYLMAAAAFGSEFLIHAYEEVSILRILADNLYLLSVVTAVVAFAIRFKEPVPVKRLAAIYIVAIAAVAAVYAHMFDVIAKAYIISSACSFMMALVLPIIRNHRQTRFNKILYWAAGISSATLMANAAVLVMTDKNLLLADNASEIGFLAVLNFSAMMVALVIALCLFISYSSEVVSEFQEKSNTDTLTSVFNRGAFEAHVEIEITKSEANNLPLSLVVADIDFFKNVNDTYGHVVGDDVIKAFSATLSNSVRVGDTVGRVGGEEFCILLSTANSSMAKMIAEAARTNFEQGRYVEGDENKILTASFGVAQLQSGDKYEDLFKRADAALYLSKDTGRNKTTVYSDATIENEALLSG